MRLQRCTFLSCHSRRDWHLVMYLVFAGIDLLRCGRTVPRLATAKISTTCCCEHVGNPAAVHITIWKPQYRIHDSPRSRSIQVELGKVEGFWSALQNAITSISQVFECWAASSLATDTGENQSDVTCDVIMSYWVRSIGLRHLEFMPELVYKVLLEWVKKNVQLIVFNILY